MTGWITLALMGGAAFTALRLAGVTRGLGTIVAAALSLGATGYAVQQHASLPGHPIRADTEKIDIDPDMVAFRAAIMPATPAETNALATADDRVRDGDTTGAADLLLRAIARQPRSAVLWTGLGNALSLHDGGQLSPAARLAFRRAWELAPDRPGPPFFLGAAFLQAGDLPAAKTAWLRALRLTPHDAPWRVMIAERLVMIDQFQAMMAAGPR